MRTLAIFLMLLSGCASPPPAPALRHAEDPMPASLLQYGVNCGKTAQPLRLDQGAFGYPESALKAGYMDGWVIVRYDIAKGRTHNATIVASSPALFEATALRAVASMEYAEDVLLAQCITPFKFRVQP